jgi:hypothetical protein
MAELYKRLVEITVSEPLISPDEYKDPEKSKESDKPSPPVSGDYNTTDKAKQIVITELDFVAKIAKTRSASANTLDLTIYNLNETTQSLLRKEGTIIIVKAGYESFHGSHANLPTLFIGQVSYSEVAKTGTRVATRINAVDGGEVLKNQRISYSAKAGESVTKVIEDLALSFRNVVKGHLAIDDIEGEVFPTGYSAFGLLRDVFTDLCKSRKLKYSIENNSIYVFPDSWFRLKEESGAIAYNSEAEEAWKLDVSKAKSSNFDKGVVLKFTPNDVISAKSLTERRSAKNGSGKGTDGISLTVPTYNKYNLITDKVRLSDEFDTNVSGDYTIESVDISLESRDGEWITTLELTSDSN